jgi:hypothetical protein
VPELRATPKKRTLLSLVWFIAILAAVVGAWVAVTRILSEGPKITITLKSAEGLEAGKTKIHYNGVDIGTMTTRIERRFLGRRSVCPYAQLLLRLYRCLRSYRGLCLRARCSP